MMLSYQQMLRRKGFCAEWSGMQGIRAAAFHPSAKQSGMFWKYHLDGIGETIWMAPAIPSGMFWKTI
ncbi:hypothetical protein [Candidatus Electronema sp. TJ]|uniref:hypothetical protein n=1 Tax=Candidatus Electronema sp. TJ TaxID=3401573 RepID=UPI003AA80864